MVAMVNPGTRQNMVYRLILLKEEYLTHSSAKRPANKQRRKRTSE